MGAEKLIRWVILLAAAGALLWFFVGNVSQAGTVTASWTNPTKRCA